MTHVPASNDDHDDGGDGSGCNVWSANATAVVATIKVSTLHWLWKYIIANDEIRAFRATAEILVFNNDSLHTLAQ